VTDRATVPGPAPAGESTAAAPGSVRHALAGRRLVITGFTGFLAKVFVALLLESVPEIGQIYLIVRRRARKEPAVRRFERAVETSPVFRPLRARHGADLAAWLGARITVLDGDVERPACELATETLARLTGRIDLIVHCAGLTDFMPDPTEAVSVNVAGAAHVADLATRLGAPLMHISTAYVAGDQGSVTVPESLVVGRAPNGTAFQAAGELRALTLACRAAGADAADRKEAALARARQLGWPNLYTYTKGLAEHLIGDRPGVTIVRPSIVECARTFPFPGWNEGLNTAGPLAWLITTPYRRLPAAPDHRFDVIPVDDVARGMVLITREILEGRGGGVFHLASSDVNPLTFGRCIELTGLAFRRWTRKGGGTPWEQHVIRHLDPVPGPEDADRGIGRWSELLQRARDAADWIEAREDRLGGALADRARGWSRQTSAWLSDVDRVEKMLDLYQPFIHDNDYRFVTDRVRALGRTDPDLRWEVDDICWRTYWVDIEYPGLQRWCIPLIRGERAPTDPPGPTPFRLPHLLESP
jgi:nucleoside-diphosphate-sugar epimerase